MHKRKTAWVAALGVAGALLVPSVASADTLRFYGPADLAPGQNAQTLSHQFRYGKYATWVAASRCVKMWYRNNGSSTNYASVTDCQSYLLDTRNTSPAGATTWAYCRNVDTATINIACYTCVNNDVGCQ